MCLYLHEKIASKIKLHFPGADPGIFVRGGGSNFPKILTSKKKNNNNKRGRGKRLENGGGWGGGGSCGGYFHSAEVWFKSTFQTIIYIQVYFR